MKKSLGIILFVIIATLLYSTSELTKKEELNSTLTKENEVNLTLTKREEILLISKNIKSIQQELNQINNKNAKLNSTFFLIEYELSYYALNYLGQTITRQLLILETLYRNKLSPLSNIKVKDSEIQELQKEIQKSLRFMYNVNLDFTKHKFKIRKDNTEIQKLIDQMSPIATNSKNASNSFKIEKEVLMELEISQAASPIIQKQTIEIIDGLKDVKQIAVDTILSFQKTSLKQYEKILKDFNSKYKIK